MFVSPEIVLWLTEIVAKQVMAVEAFSGSGSASIKLS